VASDAGHRSRDEIIRRCVVNALARAEAAGCRSLAMPIFATGHAHVNWARGLRVMAEAVKESAGALEIVFVVFDPDRADEARSILATILSSEIAVSQSPAQDVAPGWWSDLG
jgi:O-acetyl-ADP-ribose deacetylase (regulator of RNase III)